MRHAKLLLCLFSLFIYGCGQSDDGGPGEENSIRLLRMELYPGEGAAPVFTYYYYEDDLLVSATNSNGVITRYSYEDRTLVGYSNNTSSELIGLASYEYRGDTVSFSHTQYIDGQPGQTFESEYVNQGPSQKRINHYRLENGQRILGYYTVCQLQEGNVLEETQFGLDGNAFGLKTQRTFYEALNPEGLWVGHPQIQSKNLFETAYRYFGEEFVLGDKHTQVVLNGANLPVEVSRLTIIRGDSSTRLIKYFYEE